jgi:hypothetical protein
MKTSTVLNWIVAAMYCAASACIVWAGINVIRTAFGY